MKGVSRTSLREGSSDVQVFGKSSHHPTASLPQHGFARISTWRVIGETENAVTFELRPEDLDSGTRRLWEADFTLTYTVELDEKELKTEFQVYNPGADGFECHTLLHTYLRVPVYHCLTLLTVGRYQNWN
jgi:glucose-6-phosphate 1-epimerase